MPAAWRSATIAAKQFNASVGVAVATSIVRRGVALVKEYGLVSTVTSGISSLRFTSESC